MFFCIHVLKFVVIIYIIVHRAFNLGLCFHLSCKNDHDSIMSSTLTLISSMLETLVDHHHNLRTSIHHSSDVDPNVHLAQLIVDTRDIAICSIEDLCTQSLPEEESISCSSLKRDVEITGARNENSVLYTHLQSNRIASPSGCAVKECSESIVLRPSSSECVVDDSSFDTASNSSPLGTHPQSNRVVLPSSCSEYVVKGNDKERFAISSNSVRSSKDLLQNGQTSKSGTPAVDVADLAQKEVFKSIDLSKQPFRCTLYKLSPKELALAITFHHIIMDGTSLYIITRDLLKLLNGESLPPSVNHGHRRQCQHVPSTIASSCDKATITINSSSDNTESESGTKPAIEENAGATDGKTDRQLKGKDSKTQRKLSKWIDLLSSADKCTSFPTIYPLEDPNASEHAYLPISHSTLTALNSLTELAQVSTVVILSSMFACALANLTSSDDIIIGMVSSNRGRDSRDIVNYFANTLPLRVDFSDRGQVKTLPELLKHVKRNWSMVLDGSLDLADLLPHVSCLKRGVQSSISESPLQVLFSYYNVTEGNSLPEEVKVGGVEMSCRVHSPKPGHTHTDLVLEVDPTKKSDTGSQLFTWEFRMSSLTRSHVESLHLLTCNFIEAANSAYSRGEINVRPLDLTPKCSYLAPSDQDPQTECIHLFSLDTTDDEVSSISGNKSVSGYNPSSLLSVDSNQTRYSVDISELSIATGPIFKNPRSLNEDGTPLCFMERFDKVVSEFPNSPAFVFPNQDVLTYRQVSVIATKIALVLKRKGVQVGDHVGLYMTRTPWLYVIILGILKCAAAYVPIALQDTRERALKILALSNARLLVAESDLNRCVQNYKGTVILFDSAIYQQWLEERRHDSQDVFKEFSKSKIDYDPERTFYILFTSGTTGEPKGVAISERNMHATLNNLQFLFTPVDMKLTLAAANVSFDGHVADAIGPLLNHACLVVAECLLDLSNLEKLEDNPALGRVTYTFATPSSASVVDFPQTMQALIVGGEVFSRACYINTLSISKVVNGYGPTECTAFVSTNHLPRITECSSEKLTEEEIASIGVPAPNVTLMILDDSRMLVPIGTAGVLHVSGPTVSSVGYYGCPDRTGKSFFPNPLVGSCDPDEKSCDQSRKSCDIVYCTGDYVKMLTSGKLQFLGRKDDQVKLRGVRFHLLEVEHALSSCPYITSVVVFIKNQGTPSAQLVACVTPDTVDTRKVKQFASDVLPKFMVPSVVVGVRKMPLTKTGKVDKNTLERIIQDARNGHVDELRPDEQEVRLEQNRTNEKDLSSLAIKKNKGDPLLKQDKETLLEDGLGLKTNVGSEDLVPEMATILARAFGKVLGLSQYTVHDDFFTNGGHSLLSFHLLSEVNKVAGVSLNLTHVLHNTTPLQLAQIVVNMSQTGNGEGRKKTVQLNNGKEKPKENGREENKINLNLQVSGPITLPTQSHLTTSFSTSSTTTVDLTTTNYKPQVFDYLNPVPDVPIPEHLKTQLEILFKRNGHETTSTNPDTDCHSSQDDVSLSLSEVSDHLARASGHCVPTNSLSHYGSVDMLQSHLKLKTIIDFKSSPHHESVVVLLPKQSSDDVPLFFVHAGIIGWALPYYKLAHTIGTYSIAIQHTHDAPSSSFEEMAAYYLQQIQHVQSHGPYRLAGVCYGALLVFEIARQLSELGEQVQLAVLINNSPSYEKMPLVFNNDLSPLPGTTVHPYSFYEASLGLDFSTNLKHLNRPQTSCEILVSAILDSYPWLPFSTQDLVNAYLQFYLPIKAAWSGSYKPHPLIRGAVGSVVLIRNRTHPFFESHDYGLLRLVDKEVLSVLVSKDRLGMLSDRRTMNYIASIIKLHLAV